MAKHFWSVKVGERAENLRQAARRFNNVDSLTMATREKLLGKEIVDNNRPEGEDMHIGDDNSVVHQYMPAQGNTAGTLAKLALGAGLIATGVGVPVGGWLIADALKNRPAPVADPNIDTDTQYEIGLEK
ncbi:hypothetical protein [Gimesia fumaroli]|nr:hypothetical protein [Gimesia fumaroli]